MSWSALLTQLVLPVLLLVWLWLSPAKTWPVKVLQFVSVAMILLGISLAALWVMPPFWTPYLYALLFVVIVIRHLKLHGRAGRRAPLPSSTGFIITLLVAGLGLFGAYLAYKALQGRVIPGGEVVNIAAPFAPGHYIVAHGGATSAVNVHLKTLDKTVERYLPWRGQSKAMDIFRITPSGLHKSGWQPVDPSRYTTFGVPVVAPCRGEIALVVDGIEDMPVPEMDAENMAGNYVAIDCGSFFVVLAHLRQGSILVSKDEQVNIGDPLARVGNSGNSSEPHLHVHAQRGLPEIEPLSGEPLWLTINGRFLVRNSRLEVR